jgi:sigma-B regulation protein RsbU (phosphoserine phosphatase)
LEDLLTAGSRIFFQTHLYPLVVMQKKANEIFLSFLTRQKTPIPVLLNLAYHESGNGDFEIYCGGMQISQRNRFEKELLEAKKVAQQALDENVELIEMRNQLQATQQQLELQLRNLSGKNIDQTELSKVLTHDLQEPLRKISLFSSKLLALHQTEQTPNSTEALKKIMGFVQKVRRLLDGLEEFNSIDSKILRFAPVDLSEAIETAKNYSSLLTDDLEIEFVNQIEKSNAEKIFNSDFKLLVNLLNELIKNAVKFKNPNAEILKITITADRITRNVFTEIKDKYQYEDYLRLTFTDNGIGNLNLQANAFELFKKFDSLDDELGIGLAYCRKIVQLLNGKIAVSSNDSGGTTFTITLPFNSNL